MMKKFIPQVISSKLGRQVLTVQKHSPSIMFGAGVAGVVVAGVLACRATLKIEKVFSEQADMLEAIRNTELNTTYTDEDRKKDLAIFYTRRAVTATKLYSPALAIGAVSLSCLWGSHRVLTTRNAGLAAAYATLDKGFKEYRARVVETVGEDKEREIRYAYETVQRTEETENGAKLVSESQPSLNGASMYARFFDQFSKNWSKQPGYNQIFLQCQQQYMNDLLKSRGHLFLNEVYDALGLERTKEGQVVGWVLGNGDNYVDFGIFTNDTYRGQAFVVGDQDSVLLDFNVDGVIYDLI